MSNVYVEEMEMNDLVFTTEDGETHTAPIVGIFAVKDKHYVVVLEQSEETGEQELLLLKAEQGAQGDYVQMIDDKEEWIKASQAWHSIVNKLEKGEYRKLEG